MTDTRALESLAQRGDGSDELIVKPGDRDRHRPEHPQARQQEYDVDERQLEVERHRDRVRLP